MARKVRELIADLEKHGFVDRAARVATGISRIRALPGRSPSPAMPGDDAKKYQEKAVKAAITEVKK